MPITKGAKKALRASLRKKSFNDKRKKDMNKAVKSVKSLVLGGKAQEAAENLSHAYKAIDKAAKRGVIKKNTAARKKSRLVRLIKRGA